MTRFRSRKVMVVFGTRPEAIKLAPVVRALQESTLEARVCVTGQHREMLDQMLRFFDLPCHHDLAVMQANQDLSELTARLLSTLRSVLVEEAPDAIVVQGDTTTTFAATLAAYYQRIPTGHVEAGLRTGNPYNPFPEEINRRLTTQIAAWHYAPTELARRNLYREGIAEDRVFLTGNTIVDAVREVSQRLGDTVDEVASVCPEEQLAERRLVLVTGHRRESFGDGLRGICTALRAIADAHEDIVILYPMHLNPNVRRPVTEVLGSHPRIVLTEPLDYLQFTRLMRQAYLIITDSGGVQEEAPSYGVPVLVVRDTTERPEGVEAGVARLVGTRAEAIVAAASELLGNPAVHRSMVSSTSPYGDGHAAERIVQHLERALT